jgi:hypothetical protein
MALNSYNIWWKKRKTTNKLMQRNKKYYIYLNERQHTIWNHLPIRKTPVYTVTVVLIVPNFSLSLSSHLAELLLSAHNLGGSVSKLTDPSKSRLSSCVSACQITAPQLLLWQHHMAWNSMHTTFKKYEPGENLNI